MMKKFLFWILIIIGIIALLIALWLLRNPRSVAEDTVKVDIQIQFDYFRDIEELKSRSSDIVQLEILDYRAEWINFWAGFEGVRPQDWRERYELFTIHRARVLNVFQGDLMIGEIIEVRQLGGSLDGEIWTTPSTADFSYGDHVVLFLIGGDLPHFGIMSPSQGTFVVNDDEELLSYHSFNNLELTWEILGQIQSDNGIEPSHINETGSSYTEGSNSMKKIGVILTGTILVTVLSILIIRKRNSKK